MRGPPPERSTSANQPPGFPALRSTCARAACIRPRLPESMNRLRSTAFGAKRRTYPTSKIVSAASAARCIATASATSIVSGFSSSTCLPAAIAAIAISAWLSFQVQILTASTSACSRSALYVVKTCSMPRSAATVAARSPSRSAIAVTTALRFAAYASKWNCAIEPAPITPTVSGTLTRRCRRGRPACAANSRGLFRRRTGSPRCLRIRSIRTRRIRHR